MKPSAAVIITLVVDPSSTRLRLCARSPMGESGAQHSMSSSRSRFPPGDPIYKFENVLVSPHCADQTKTWLRQAMRFFLQQYDRFSTGQPLENIVEKHLGY